MKWQVAKDQEFRDKMVGAGLVMLAIGAKQVTVKREHLLALTAARGSPKRVEFSNQPNGDCMVRITDAVELDSNAVEPPAPVRRLDWRDSLGDDVIEGQVRR